MSDQPHLIEAESIVDGWRDSMRLLLDTGKRLGLLVFMRDASTLNPADLLAHDPGKIDDRAMSLADVANTIFPAKSDRWALDTQDFTKYYRAVYERLLRKRRPRPWGFYANRLMGFGEHSIDQLDRIVTGMRSWGNGHKAAFVVHFSSADLDRPRPQGGPCLQYCQFSRGSGDRLCLTAVYRSHDYYAKALGNFIGLSRLLTYVADCAELEVGSFTCLSTYAFYSSSKARAEQLLME
jgi:thymidylate synthase